MTLSGREGSLTAFGQLPFYADANERGHLPSLRKTSPDCSTTEPAMGAAAVGEITSSSEGREIAAPSSAWRQF